MSDTLRDDVVVARKCHNCDACGLWRDSGYQEIDVTADEWLIVQAAEADGWQILRGQSYRKLVYKDGGDLLTYNARLGMDTIVLRYDLGGD